MPPDHGCLGCYQPVGQGRISLDEHPPAAEALSQDPDPALAQIRRVRLGRQVLRDDPGCRVIAVEGAHGSRPWPSARPYSSTTRASDTRV